MKNFVPISTATMVAQAVAGLARASRFPLSVSCLGDLEFDGGLAHGGQSTEQTVILTRATCLEEAIAHAETCIEDDAITELPDGASAFVAKLIVIQDDEKCLALAGKVHERSVSWCPPVMSDGEARLVVQKASAIRSGAAYEARRSNQLAAHRLRFRATVLEGRLVDPFWRATAHTAVLLAA